MLITSNTCLKWSVVVEKPLYLVFKSNQWFDLWLVGLPPTSCRFKVDLIHTNPNQASKSGQTYRFRSQSPVGWPTFSLKAIYGLKQASRQWNIKIHQSLLDLGFTWTYSDASIYVYQQQRRDSITIVVLYVNNLLLLGDSKNHIKTVKRTLSRQYKMTDLGPVECFLGLHFCHDCACYIIDIDQEDYIQSVLEHFQMANCNPSNTPLLARAVLISYDRTASDAN